MDIEVGDVISCHYVPLGPREIHIANDKMFSFAVTEDGLQFKGMFAVEFLPAGMRPTENYRNPSSRLAARLANRSPPNLRLFVCSLVSSGP